MSIDEKNQYKPENKQHKTKFPVQQQEAKYNCKGFSLQDVQRLKNEEADEKRKIDLSIEEILLTAMHENKLEKCHFFFISVSYFLKRTAGSVWPCELAMTEFCIQDGVVDSMHMMIDPGEFPKGYASEIILLSNDTHRRKPSDLVNGESESDYCKIFDKIMEFICAKEYSSKAIPIIYTGFSNEDLDAVKLTLEQFAMEKGYDYNAFRVYPIEVLLFKLQKKCILNQKELNLDKSESLGSQVFAKHCLENDEYAYAEIGCLWHNADDFSERCCLSKVKRWGYTFVKYCIDSRFTLLPGQHFPETYHTLDEIELKSTSSKHSDLHILNFRSSTATSDVGGSSSSLVTRLTSRKTDGSCSNWIGNMIKKQQPKAP